MSVDVYQVTSEEEVRLQTTCEDIGDSVHLIEGQEEVRIRKVDTDCHHPHSRTPGFYCPLLCKL